MRREDFFITVSRFVTYKRLDLIVETFTKLGKPLVVIGDGPDRRRIQGIAGPNVKLLGYRSDEEIAAYLGRARAFVFAANEDFGIVPVEAQAAGCPVIAYAKGGALETVVGWPTAGATGVFFDEQTPESLETAVKLFEAHKEEIKSDECRRNAERFSQDRFCAELREAIQNLWLAFLNNPTELPNEVSEADV